MTKLVKSAWWIIYYYDEDFWGGQKDGCAGLNCQTVVLYNLGTLSRDGHLEGLSIGLENGEAHGSGTARKAETSYITFDGLLAVLVGRLLSRLVWPLKFTLT